MEQINRLRTQFKAMSEYTITLKPVYSCPANHLPSAVALPEGWTLSWHQVATLEALRDPDLDTLAYQLKSAGGEIWIA